MGHTRGLCALGAPTPHSQWPGSRLPLLEKRWQCTFPSVQNRGALTQGFLTTPPVGGILGGLQAMSMNGVKTSPLPQQYLTEILHFFLL